MSWKIVNACRYFYESTEVDGDRVEICWGKGAEGFAAAQRVERERVENRRDKALIRSWRTRDAAIDSMVRDSSDSLLDELHSTLALAGLHRHKGQWRRRRKVQRVDKDIEELRKEVMNKEATNRKSAPAVQPVEQSHLDAVIRTRSVDSLAEVGYSEEQIDRIRREVDDKIREILTTFSTESATSFEQMVTEQIATAWVQWYVASLLLDSASFAARSWRQNQYLEQRYQRCQARLSRVIDQLSRIRCIPRCYLTLSRRSP